MGAPGTVSQSSARWADLSSILRNAQGGQSHGMALALFASYWPSEDTLMTAEEVNESLIPDMHQINEKGSDFKL